MPDLSAVRHADGLCWEWGELHPKHFVAAASSFLVVASFPIDPVLLPRDHWEEQAEGFQGADQVQSQLYFD